MPKRKYAPRNSVQPTVLKVLQERAGKSTNISDLKKAYFSEYGVHVGDNTIQAAVRKLQERESGRNIETVLRGHVWMIPDPTRREPAAPAPETPVEDEDVYQFAPGELEESSSGVVWGGGTIPFRWDYVGKDKEGAFILRGAGGALFRAVPL